MAIISNTWCCFSEASKSFQLGRAVATKDWDEAVEGRLDFISGPVSQTVEIVVHTCKFGYCFTTWQPQFCKVRSFLIKKYRENSAGLVTVAYM